MHGKTREKTNCRMNMQNIASRPIALERVRHVGYGHALHSAIRAAKLCSP